MLTYHQEKVRKGLAKGVGRMEKATVSRATLGRLPQYLQFLRELPADQPHTSATAIARALNLGEVQVRKDLGMISGQGKPRVGYATGELIRSLEKALGCDGMTCAVLVGAGKLGRALLEYDEFGHYGVQIAAAFDSNAQTLRLSRTIEILPMQGFEDFCRGHNIRIGIITVGQGSAQEVCERMIRAGITAIWNFAPCKLETPPGILLRQENLALSLAHLNNQLRSMN